ncbi:MAG: hypothetical protein KDD69_15865, partial [Bdellovibrionales bacterium]|nr:hypothetical protein [Bdellovibrionales bacterium]
TAGMSSVVEIANVADEPTTALMELRSADGNLLDQFVVPLAGHATQHIIVDAYLRAVGDFGVAFIQGVDSESIVAVGMQYGRTDTLGLRYMYGIEAQQSLGTSLRGSYNTFLGQGCELLLTNSSATAQTVTISMQRSDGTTVIEGESVVVPTRGGTKMELCSREAPDFYGLVTVTAPERNTIGAVIVRRGADTSYAFPTPVRQ